VTPTDLGKALSFFAAMREDGDQLGWEITALIAGKPRILRLDGRHQHDGILVTGTLSPETDELLDQLSGISNEQSSFVRAMERGEDAHDVLGRLTQLNNKFANLQRDLARKNAELEEESERKSLALGIAAHDLRSPLNVIFGYSEMLEMYTGDKLSESELGMVRMVRQTASYMLAIVDSLLCFAEADSGRLVLAPSEFDLAELTRLVVSLDGELAKRRSIMLRAALPQGGLPVLADRHKLQQVLHNLIGNAVKYSPRGADVEIRLSDLGETARLEVVDQGVGIPDHEQNLLFQPFSRTSVRPDEGAPSTGLGLAICRNIIEAHGGAIGLQSALGQGSTFFFSLPKVMA
jgi:signal transduction histidine kinase